MNDLLSFLFLAVEGKSQGESPLRVLSTSFSFLMCHGHLLLELLRFFSLLVVRQLEQHSWIELSARR